MNSLQNFGIQLIQALQTLSPALDSPMKFFSFLGTVEFYLLLVPIIYWLVDAQLGIRVMLVLVSTDFLGASFKQLLHQPRPYWVGDVKPLGSETSYGNPSSHASVSLAVWGTLAHRLKKDWLWAVSILVLFLIGLSRLYLGVHFPHDVLGGWLLGAAVVFLYVKIEPRVLPWLKTRIAAVQIGIGFGVSLVMILLGQLILALIASSPDPAAWAQFSTGARSPSQYFTFAGALFGAIAGFVLMWQSARFQTKGSLLQKVGRYLLGILGLLFIYLGLDMLFSLVAADETAVGYVLRYIRYGAVTFWVTFGAPWAFLRLKLAEPAADGGSDISPK